MGKSCGKFLWENLAGNSCGKILQENLVENPCGKILWKILAGNFKICKSSSGSAAGNAVGNVVGKYSFLKPILNQFLHMTHQIEA